MRLMRHTRRDPELTRIIIHRDAALDEIDHACRVLSGSLSILVDDELIALRDRLRHFSESGEEFFNPARR